MRFTRLHEELDSFVNRHLPFILRHPQDTVC
jgi:hypothetical protein